MSCAKFFLPIALCFVVVSAVEAAGMQVSPSTLALEMTSGEETQGNIAVKNITLDVALYQVSADDASDMIKIAPQSFILEAGKTQNVSIAVSGTESKVWSTLISVVQRPLAQGGFQANVGVKVPLQVRVTMDWQKNFLASLFQNLKNWFLPQNLVALFIFLLFISWIYIFMLKRKITH